MVQLDALGCGLRGVRPHHSEKDFERLRRLRSILLVERLTHLLLNQPLHNGPDHSSEGLIKHEVRAQDVQTDLDQFA